MNLAEEVETAGDLWRARQLADRAEGIVSAIRNPEWQAQALTTLAIRSRPDRALPLLARALTLGNWVPALDIIASIQSAAIIEIANEYLDYALITDERSGVTAGA